MFKSKVLLGQGLFFVIIFLSTLEIINANLEVHEYISYNNYQNCINHLPDTLKQYCINRRLVYNRLDYGMSLGKFLECCNKKCDMKDHYDFCYENYDYFG